MALFDRYLIVDWSAANTPKLGKDSIWMALHSHVALDWVRNISTRHQALAVIGNVIHDAGAVGHRLFIGLDFAFGWPRGIAARLPVNAHEKPWQQVWRYLADCLEDGADNQSNSYESAALINRDLFSDCGAGPFWGYPHQHAGRYPGLMMTKHKAAFERVPEYRHVESVVRGTKSIWQLAYNGAVGRQSMLGMAHLQRLCQTHSVAVWPFDTRFAAMLDASVVLAEIYPSMFATQAAIGEIKDETQVRVTAERFAALDRYDAFRRLLSPPSHLDDAMVADIIEQEGWIVGAGHAQ